MKRAGKLVIGVVAVIFLSSYQAGAKKKVVLTTLEGGETGRIYFDSTSPYALKSILDGSDNDTRVTIFGDLKLPKGDEGKVPAMVYMHSAGGWHFADQYYLQELNKMGVATFRPDSIRPRGDVQSVDTHMFNTGAMMAADAFSALRLLSTHPRIDPKRIGIMGRGRGGGVSVYTAWEPLRKASVEGDLRFALHISIGPACVMFKALHMTSAPIRILIGEADSWTPAKHCVELTETLKSAGYDAEIILYTGAHHSFDTMNAVRRSDKYYSLTKCRFEVQPDGTTIEKTSGLPLDNIRNKDRAITICGTRGVRYGHNGAAKKKAVKDMKEIVTRVFELKPAS